MQNLLALKAFLRSVYALQCITKRRIANGLMRVALVLGLCVVAMTGAAQQQVARLMFHWDEHHHNAKYAARFAEEVNVRTKGRLRIEVLPSDQRFGVRGMITAVSSGVVELGDVVGMIGLAPLNRDYAIATYPWLFSNFEQQRRFFTRTTSGKKIWSDLEAITGTIRVMYNPVGPVMTFATQKPLRDSMAFSQLKIRPMFSEEEALWRAFGAIPVTLATRKISKAFESGQINAMSMLPTALDAMEWNKRLAFGLRPYQSYVDSYVMANARWFESLAPDLQKIVQDVGAEIGKEATEAAMATADAALQRFVFDGGQITTLRTDAKAEFDTVLRIIADPALKGLVQERVRSEAFKFVGLRDRIAQRADVNNKNSSN